MSRLSKLLIGLIALISTGAYYPAFWTSSIIGNASFLIFFITLILWFLTLAICGTKFQSLSKQYNYLYAILGLYYIARLLFTLNEEYLINIVQLMTFYLYTFLVYNSYKNKYIVVKYYTRFHIIMIGLTIAGTILYYSGVISGFRFVSMGGRAHTVLLDYGFFYVKSHSGMMFDSDMFIRPAGYYDEPGSFGLVSVLLLILNRKTLKNKLHELLLLFGSLVTLSMAYIYSFILFMFLFYINRKNMKYVLFTAVVMAMLIGYVGIEDGGYLGYFYKSTIERTENIAEGTDVSRDYVASYKAFSDNLLFGATMDELDHNYPNATHETIWYYFAQNGIFGVCVLFSPFIYLFIRNRNTLDKKLLILIVLNLLQRPHYIAPLYLTILYFAFFLNNAKPALSNK